MIAIRRMQARDVEKVEQIEVATFSMPWSRQGFLDALNLDTTIFLVAEENEEVVGYIGMYYSFDEGEITNVAVAKAQRCRGIGELLIQEMKKEATKHSLSGIVLEVRVSNDSAIRLYERNGFVNLGIRTGFYEMPKEDAYIMRCGQ